MNICAVSHCDRVAEAKGLCKRHWSRKRKGHNPHVRTFYEKTPKERFFEKVNMQGPDDCWLWLGHTRGNGALQYGIFWLGGKVTSAHRFSYQLEHGEIPDINGADYRGTCVLHKCDNPLCVNPNHLFIGTHDDNMKDKVSKNRGTGSITHCHNGHEFTDKNTYISKQGLRHCRICSKLRERKRRANLKQTERSE